MNEQLIRINYDNEIPQVSGRELHSALEVQTAYKDWFPRMAEYGFSEGTDFRSILSESTGGRPSTDHILTVGMAKEIAMLQRTDKGKQVRQYFIELEKAWNTPERIMARALKIADMNIKALRESNDVLKTQIAADRPKVIFADAVSVSDGSILIGDLAKILKGNGIEIGQKRLFEWLRKNGYLIKRNGADWNSPTQRAMEMELFKIKETAVTHSDGHVTISKTVKVTGKGQQYFVNLFLGNNTVALK